MADEIQKPSGVTIPVNSVPTGGDDANVPDLAIDDPSDPFNDARRELRTRFELLPEELQKIIIDEGYQKNLFDIAKAQKLTYEELGTLEIETTMVLLGMVKPEDYRDQVQEQLKKNDPEIDALVKEVNEKIFAPINASLQKVYSAKREPIDYLKDEETPEAPAAQMPKPIIPTPPPTPAPSLSSTDKSILEKTGVVITETPTVRAATAAPMPSRTDLLKDIENPPKAPAVNIVANKLGGSAPIMPPKTTDYSMPKGTSASGAPTMPSVKMSDPYREKID